MKRTLVMAAVVVGLACGGVVSAGELPGLREWVNYQGTNAMVGLLAGAGVTNPVERAAIAATCDEDLLVDALVKCHGYGPFDFILKRDKFSAESRNKIRNALLAEPVPPDNLLGIVWTFPKEERGVFTPVMEKVVEKMFPGRPEFARLTVKYWLLQTIPVPSDGMSDEDLVRFLVAPEIMRVNEATSVKQIIKNRAVALARQRLRADGKSFVMKDGVNPLVVLVKPVVDALNAAECAGLEVALGDLGGQVPYIDRNALHVAVATWQAKILAGELADSSLDEVLGKVQIGLGTDGFNKFVEVYNKGTAGAK